ncbi:MAG: hypothetical protein WCF57_06835 [Pyrinomonadaceae bacterium]
MDGSYAIPGLLPLVAFIIGYLFAYAGVGGYFSMGRNAPQSLCHMRWRSPRCSCSSILAFNPHQQPLR